MSDTNIESWGADRVRIVSVAELRPGMKVVRRKNIWTVATNLGWLFFHQGKADQPPQWSHIILFRRFDGGEFHRIEGGDEISFFWAFKRSDVTVDVLE